MWKRVTSFIGFFSAGITGMLTPRAYLGVLEIEPRASRKLSYIPSSLF